MNNNVKLKKCRKNAGYYAIIYLGDEMMKVATVFSGIGAIEQALKKLGLQHEIVFACDNGEVYIDFNEEKIKSDLSNISSLLQQKLYVDKLYRRTGKINYVQKTYCANYNINSENFYQDVRFLNGERYKNIIDLFVGGSPCQSFSISGNKLGLDDTRGTLFYDFARLVKEIEPKVFIYENVPGILSNDKGRTWDIITKIFDALGYYWFIDKLNSKNYGIPQDRNRVFVVGFRKDSNITTFDFPQPINLEKKVEDFLDKTVPHSYYHGEKGFKWVTNPKNLAKRVSINEDIMRTQAANQQYNWCGDMRFEPIVDNKWALINEKVFVSSFKENVGVCRKLTPRECLRLMGFNDDFKIVVPDQKIYRQAGNSIVVNVLEHLVQSIISTGVFENDKTSNSI
jgi:DNA (cytosine-5)-methyltransferase 1